MQQKHIDEVEVVPDAYKLHVTFDSCLANNMNNAVFQYYVKMTAYNEYGDSATQETGGDNPPSLTDEATLQNTAQPHDASDVKGFSREVAGILDAMQKEGENNDEDNPIEKFNEATYNKRLEKIRTRFGDLGINTDSTIDTVKKAYGLILESNRFFNKLYNAKDNMMWYRPYEKEEIYTTMQPDFRQELRKRYGERISELRVLDDEIK